jgi:hypothetical protein
VEDADSVTAEEEAEGASATRLEAGNTGTVAGVGGGGELVTAAGDVEEAAVVVAGAGEGSSP